MEIDSIESADGGDGVDDGNDGDGCCEDGAYDDGDGKSLYSHHMYGSEDAGEDGDDDVDVDDDNGNAEGLCRSVLSISKYCEQNTSQANFCTAAAASSSRPPLSFVSTNDDTSSSSSRIHMFTG